MDESFSLAPLRWTARTKAAPDERLWTLNKAAARIAATLHHHADGSVALQVINDERLVYQRRWPTRVDACWEAADLRTSLGRDGWIEGSD